MTTVLEPDPGTAEPEPRRPRRWGRGAPEPGSNRRKAGGDRGKGGTIRVGGRPRLQLPGMNVTTADAGLLYPGLGSSAFGVQGVYLGTDELTSDGAFHFELLEAKKLGLIDNTNMMVFGRPGKGKSALIKTLILRILGAYGTIRYPVIIDVKGEYVPLAEHTGMQVMGLRRGGTLRLNPLGRRVPDESAQECTQRRVTMLSAMCGALLDRPLTLPERAVLYAAVLGLTELETAQNAQATLDVVVRLLRQPTPAMRSAVQIPDGDITKVIGPVLVALESLLNGVLAGRFDGPTTIDVNPARNRGLVVDLSDVNANDDLLPVVLVAVTAWLYELMRADWGACKKLQIFDEAWYLFNNLEVVRFMQGTWKLGRSYGFGNIAIMHRPSDLWSQAAPDSPAGLVAAGLLTDTDVVVSYNQRPDELRKYGDMVGWTPAEQHQIMRLSRGQSLWAIGDNVRVKLTHLLGGQLEHSITNTDTNLLKQ